MPLPTPSWITTPNSYSCLSAKPRGQRLLVNWTLQDSTQTWSHEKRMGSRSGKEGSCTATSSNGWWFRHSLHSVPHYSQSCRDIDEWLSQETWGFANCGAEACIIKLEEAPWLFCGKELGTWVFCCRATPSRQTNGSNRHWRQTSQTWSSEMK